MKKVKMNLNITECLNMNPVYLFLRWLGSIIELDTVSTMGYAHLHQDVYKCRRCSRTIKRLTIPSHEETYHK